MIEFEVKASRDVFIGLTSAAEMYNVCEPEIYEIVIGGWGNTQSVIRRGQLCTNCGCRVNCRIPKWQWVQGILD